MMAPSRPDPVIREGQSWGRPLNPSRPEEGDTSGYFAAMWVALLILVAVAMFAFMVKDTPPDKREIRRFGDLECVYNVTADKIESCSR